MNYATIWVRAGLTLVIIGVLGWLGGCSDSPHEPILVDSPPQGLIVSDPVLGASGAGVASGSVAPAARASSAGDAVAYVSLVPGTVPTGRTATIRRVGGGGSIITAMFDGGFDPVPVGAEAGDSIEIVVTDATGGPLFQARVAVAAARPPVVVRTDPPRKKTDVPLNSAIVVVFSEPVDASILTGSSVQLRTGSTSVAGRLEFLDVQKLAVAFVPVAPLAASTGYHLVLTQGIRDLDGQPLEAPVTVEFTTAATPPATGASVTITPNTLRMVPDSSGHNRVVMVASVRDENGNEILWAPVVWSIRWSSNTTTETGGGGWDISGRSTMLVHTGGAPGSATISATSGGRTGTATVLVDYVTLSGVSVGSNGLRCFLTPAGAAYCQGNNDVGQLGLGVRYAYADEFPVGVAGGLTFAQISAGALHSCGVTTSGAAYCWGANWFGQLGDGTTIDRATPVPIAGGLMFVEIAAGWDHSCGLTSTGRAYCWGGNQGGQLGDGTTTASPTPVAVAGGLSFAQISAGGGGNVGGGDQSCAVATGGAAYCWGANGLGQLGDGTTTDRSAPVFVASGLSFAQVSAGDGHTCGVTTSGAAHCWGSNWAGLLGTGSPAMTSSSPVAVALPNGVTVTEVTAGSTANCALAVDGAAYCWGYDLVGTSSYVPIAPTRVSGSLTFASVSSGLFHACGVGTDRIVYCWDLPLMVATRVAGQP